MDKSMFESIKESLQNKNSGFGDILKLEVGKSYEVKILPNITKPAKTFFHFFVHGWNSFATGSFVSVLSPTTFNERDPISEERYRILNFGSDQDKERIKKVRRQEKWLVNVYVIKDPTNPENEGKVKILRYGKQLHTIIQNAIDGDDADEFGEKVFDFGENNAVLKIKCEKQGDYPSYTSSRFSTGTGFKLDEQKVKEVLNSLHDLESVYEKKDYDSVKEFFNTHYFVDLKKASTKEEEEIKKELTSNKEDTSSNKADSSDADDTSGEDFDADIDAILDELE